MDGVITARDVGKCYQLYARPSDRLKQALWRGRRTYFREFWALRGVSFDIRKGETVGILGSNGSGKSTLLQIVCGILRPSTGFLDVRGRVAALLELGAGFNPDFTGRENVYMNGAILGLSQREISSRMDDIAEFAGIGDFLDQPVKTYSSGMYVRLAFAVAVNVSPDILVVDEALSVGDVRFQQKCMAKIRRFCETGTVLFVSHDMSAVTELCHRAIWVEGGRIRQDGAPKEVVERYLEYMYEGDAAEGRRLEPAATSVPPPPTPGIDDEAGGYIAVPPETRHFGDLGVVIEYVRMASEGAPQGVVYSERACVIGMVMACRDAVTNPIVGFLIKDRMGREIIGDNTGLLKLRLTPMDAGQRWRVEFRVSRWPNIQEGDYTLSLAIADGTLEDHVQRHWLHDIVAFRSLPERPPAGLLSMADTEVNIRRLSSEN